MMLNSFRYAFSGLIKAIKTERNLRIHLIIALYTIILGAITGVSKTEWCIIILCIGGVISAELINTALERLSDYISPGISREIGLVKDIAAGAVLIFTITAVVIGCVIFLGGEKLSEAIRFVEEHPLPVVLIISTVPITVYFISRGHNVNQHQMRKEKERNTHINDK